MHATVDCMNDPSCRMAQRPLAVHQWCRVDVRVLQRLTQWLTGVGRARVEASVHSCRKVLPPSVDSISMPSAAMMMRKCALSPVAATAWGEPVIFPRISK